MIQIDALDRILRNTRRLQKLIDDILDLAKIEAGRLELVEKPMPITSLVETLRSSLEPKKRRARDSRCTSPYRRICHQPYG